MLARLLPGALRRRNTVEAEVPIGTSLDFRGSSVPAKYLAEDGAAVSRITYAALFDVIGTTYGAGDGSTTFNVPDSRGRLTIGAGTGTLTEDVAAASVSTGDDNFTVASNTDKWITGMAVQVSTSGGLPAGLSAMTTYYIIRESATEIQFATSLANAVAGTAIDLTSQGTGTHTVTHTLTARNLGDRGGEEAHANTVSEIAAHNHNGSTVPTTDTDSGSGRVGEGGGGTDHNRSLAIASDGGSAAHNNMQPYGVATKIIRAL